MNTYSNSINTFLDILRAGLWENGSVHYSNFTVHGNVDWELVFKLAEEQSVIGLVLAGLEHFDIKPPQDMLLQVIGEVQIIEQQNKAMNDFVAKLIDKLRKEDVYAILVKGQGIAQCYERPLWRPSGDVDLLLSEDNYQRAKKILIPLADNVEQEYKTFKHIGMAMKDDYVVELHGTLHSRLSNRVDRVIDEAQKDVFFGGNVRSWQNGETQVFMPGEDNDVIFLFTHILHHFYIEGVGLRQICDLYRFLWRHYRKLDLCLLEKRIKKMGLMTEWKAFAALAVDKLGAPEETVPFYDSRYKGKGSRILNFVLETGNFGIKRETAIGKFDSAWNKMKDFIRHTRLFPVDSIGFFLHFVVDGVRLAIKI